VKKIIAVLTLSAVTFAGIAPLVFSSSANAAYVTPTQGYLYATSPKNNGPLSNQNAYGGMVTAQQYNMYANHINGAYSSSYKASHPAFNPQQPFSGMACSMVGKQQVCKSVRR
jgi:hypothetical protein